MKNRLFLAIRLPKTIATKLNDVKAEIQSNYRDTHWTKIENLHITMLFLGTIEMALTEVIKLCKHIIDPAFFPLSLPFKNISYAPSEKNARMIWAVFDATTSYLDLAKNMRKTFHDFLKHENPEQEVIPHITLARFKQKPASTLPPLPAINLPDLRVNSIELVSSTPTDHGRLYTTEQQF